MLERGPFGAALENSHPDGVPLPVQPVGELGKKCCTDSISNLSSTCFAYFTILLSGNYVKRVSDLPSGSFPSACPEALAAELCYCLYSPCCPGRPAMALCTRCQFSGLASSLFFLTSRVCRLESSSPG